MAYTIKSEQGNEWELVIGLETHMQVISNSKVFSSSSADYNPKAKPNSQVNFVDAAMPGMLPVINKYCVEQTIKMGLGINAKINNTSIFARKHYFYPDSPQGYQITQTIPVVGEGHLEILDDEGNSKTIRIERIHLEQDAGKLKHDLIAGKSCLDINRTGVGLMECVSMPDISSPTEATNYLRELQAIGRAVGATNGNMEEGSMRADVNVSVRKVGEQGFRTRCEIKNMVSFKFIYEAIEAEAKRQIEIYENGGEVSQETRRFDPHSRTTSTLRSKENALDYRYFPDPDLVPLYISDEEIERIRKTIPELPIAKKKRFMSDYKLSEYDADILTIDFEKAKWFEDSVSGKVEYAKPIANWLISEIFGYLNRESIPFSELKIKPSDLHSLVDLIATNVITGKSAKTVFSYMLESGETPETLVEKHGLKQMNDDSAVESIIDEIIANNPSQVENYKSGKTNLIGWFVGQVMQKTGGKANPATTNKLLTEKLNK